MVLRITASGNVGPLAMAVLMVFSAVVVPVAATGPQGTDEPVSASTIEIDTPTGSPQLQAASMGVQAVGPTGVKAPTGDGPTIGPVDEPAGSAVETVATVTLITGQEITVRERGDERLYEVESGGPVHRIQTPRGTYVFPEDVDLDTFDPSLFNVDLLVEQGIGTEETGEIPVMVQFDRGSVRVTDDAAADAGLSTASQLGVSAERRLATANTVGGTVPTARATAVYRNLDRAASVERVYPDVKLQPQTTLGQVSDYIEADTARNNHSVTGQGVSVAVLDTGVDETHPAIAGDEVLEKDFSGARNASDTIGHGTHVAGIITADAGNASYRGVAPDAKIMDLQVFGGPNGGRVSVILDAMEYADRNGADIVSMSLGGPARTARSSSPFDAMVDNLTSNGTLVVVAAGNSGPNYTSVGSPGTMKNALTVGASTADGSDVVEFSSRGPTPVALGVKPDIVAPGTDVRSTAARRGQYKPGQGWVNLSGTSMATPAISGAAALVMEADPGADPLTVKRQLVGTADRFDGQDVYTQGGGQANVDEAISTDLTVSPVALDFEYVNRTGPVTKTVTVENDGSQARTLSVDVSATEVIDDDNATDAVALNRTTVTVPAGGSAGVAVTVNTSESGAGVFSGELTVGDHSTSLGWAHGHNVTVRKDALRNGAIDSDQVAFVPHRPTLGLVQLDSVDSQSETAQFRSFGGTVSVISVGERETMAGSPIHVAKTVQVTGDTTVVLDEANTATYRLDDSGITAAEGPVQRLSSESALERTIRGGSVTIGSSLFRVLNPGTKARFSTRSDWNASVEYLLAPKSDITGNFSTALQDGGDLYHPSLATVGVSGDRTLAPDPSTMGTQRVDIQAVDAPQRYRVYSLVSPAAWEESSQTAGSTRIERGASTVRIHGTDGNTEYGVVLRGRDTTTGGSWVLTPQFGTAERVSLPAGASVDRPLNVQPLTSRQLEWQVGTAGLRLTIVFQHDQAGYAFASSDPTYVRLELGNETFEAVTGGPGIGASLPNDSRLSVGTSITLETRSANTAYSHSRATNTTYEFTYDPASDSTPPAIGDVTFQNRQAPNNRIPASGGTVLVAVDDSSNTTLEAYVSDGGPADPFATGGTGWTAATVTDTNTPGVYRVEFDPSRFAGGFVDLALRAEDDEGNAMATVTRDAMEVGGSAAGPGDVNNNGLDATDPDNDGLYEDVDGSGGFTATDVTVFLDLVITRDPAVLNQPQFFTFAGGNSVTATDVTALLDELLP